MVTYSWILHDAEGSEMRRTETFEDKAAAEAWMGTAWSDLLDEGAESVSLIEDDQMLYRMGLRAE